MLRLRSNRDGPAGRCRTRTCITARTHLTVGRRKLNLDDVALERVDRRRPAMARVAQWAHGLLVLPINREITGRKAVPLLCLPVVVATSRSDQFDPVRRVTADKQG